MLTRRQLFFTALIAPFLKSTVVVAPPVRPYPDPTMLAELNQNAHQFFQPPTADAVDEELNKYLMGVIEENYRRINWVLLNDRP